MKKIITLICCVLFSMLLLTGCASQEVNLDDAQTQQVEDNVKSLISLIVVELPADASADAAALSAFSCDCATETSICLILEMIQFRLRSW